MTTPDKIDVVAVVIGRAGSRGLPGKNAATIHGRPLIACAVEHAFAAASVDRVLCSTDGANLARFASDAGAIVVQRPAALATDEATVSDAVRHAIEHDASTASIVVILYANVPVRPHDLIDRAVAELRTTGADSVQSYAPVGKYHPHWMMELDDEGHVRPFIESKIDRRQDLPPLYIPDGGVIAVRRECFNDRDDESPHGFLGQDRRGVINPIGAVIDIDHAIDLEIAEARSSS